VFLSLSVCVCVCCVRGACCGLQQLDLQQPCHCASGLASLIARQQNLLGELLKQLDRVICFVVVGVNARAVNLRALGTWHLLC
jgi:hypothetical protein